jgi:hypothetical protein
METTLTSRICPVLVVPFLHKIIHIPCSESTRAYVRLSAPISQIVRFGRTIHDGFVNFGITTKIKIIEQHYHMLLSCVGKCFFAAASIVDRFPVVVIEASVLGHNGVRVYG